MSLTWLSVALAVSALLIVVPPTRNWIVSVILAAVRKVVRAGPPKLQSLAVQTADTLNWPSVVSGDRSNLLDRVKEVHSTKSATWTILGPLYVDLTVGPVPRDSLIDGEFNEMDPIQISLGGSAVFVGRYLFEYHGIQSHLISRLGTRHSLGAGETGDFLREESWIRGRPLVARSDSRPGAISIHLEQRESAIRTTFTHRGALTEMSWASVLDAVEKKVGRIGVLYISGYFRTALSEDLCRSLDKLSEGCVICLDHGRFRAEESRVALDRLLEAFSQGLVDVYLTTVVQAREVLTALDPDFDRSASGESLFMHLLRMPRMPRVTVMLDTDEPEVITAYGAVRKSPVEPFRASYTSQFRAGRPGPRNAFNAGFVNALIEAPPERQLRQRVQAAMEQGVSDWKRATK